MRGIPSIPNVGPFPGRAVVDEVDTEWCFVRIIERADGRFLSLEAHEGIVAGGVAMVPGICGAMTTAEVDELIAALQRVRGHLS
jgi:hypothetical protein